jgi:ElaB/YqjD/DUF883 family membrane-anchored ribosome-binding protein
MDQQQLSDFRIIAARSALTQRLAALERRVVGTTEEAMDHVKDTAATVRSAVSDTTDDVRHIWTQLSGGVRDSLDVSHFVQSHPWQTLGLAAGVGFFAGFLHRMGPGPKRDGQIGIIGDLLGVLRRELMGVGEATIAAGAAAIKQNLQGSHPPYETSSPAYHNGRA